MKVRPTTTIEWEVKDESNPIAVAPPPPRDAIQSHASNQCHTSKTLRRWGLIVSTITLLLLASFIGVKHLVNQAAANIAQVEREIALAVAADAWRRDPAAPQPHIQLIELHNDLAIVQMAVGGGVVPAESAAAETASYRYTVEGWARVEPHAPRREHYRSLETAHLFLQYDPVDRELVAAVVPAIEAFDAALRRDLGLGPPPAHAQVTVRIATVAQPQQGAPLDLVDELVDYVAWERDGVVVLSPQLARVATTRASAAVLEPALSAHVAHQLILMAVEEYQPQAIWRPLVDGLQVWAYAAQGDFDADPTNDTNKMDNLLRHQLADEAPLRLPVLSGVPSPASPSEDTPEISWQHLVLPKTVIDYVIATYGRGSLARLLEGMHQYDSWQSLIPALFNASMEEFESDWQAYVAGQFE